MAVSASHSELLFCRYGESNGGSEPSTRLPAEGQADDNTIRQETTNRAESHDSDSTSVKT